MKKIALLFFLFGLLLILFSCKKENKQVHFHGRVTNASNGSPIVQASVEISREYNSAWVGSTQVNNLGTAATDNNGNYSAFFAPPDDGTFRDYHFLVRSASGYNIGEESTTDHGTDITTNLSF